MSILILGGAGYVGSRLIPHLIEQKYKVSVIDDLWFGNYLPPEIKLIRKDLFCCGVEDFHGYEQVIFLGGISNDSMAEYNPRKNFIHNSALPTYLAYLARTAGVKRFIYASTCSVYGHINNEDHTENDIPSPEYLYGISKLQGELGVLRLQRSDFSVISLRQGTISGVSPRMRFDLFINTMFASAMTQKKIIVNNPSLWRSFFDIYDVVRVFQLMLESDIAISGIFNAATHDYTIVDAANIVASFFQDHGIAVNVDIKNIPDTRSYKMSTKKIESLLHFLPQGSIHRVLEELYESYPLYSDPYKEVYWNIKVFKSQNQGELL